MESMIRGLQAQIQALEAQLSAKVNVNFDDPYKLKPIDVKDIEKPDKYDNNIAKFTVLGSEISWKIDRNGKTRSMQLRRPARRESRAWRTFSKLSTPVTRTSNRASRTSSDVHVPVESLLADVHWWRVARTSYPDKK